MFKKILAACDDSDVSKRAFSVALDLAKHYGSELHIISVIENLPRYAEESIDDTDEMLEHARRHFVLVQDWASETAAHAGVRLERHIVPGHVVERVLELAEKKEVDTIVLGRLGHSRILHRASGGMGSLIGYHAHCSVLIVG